MSFQLLVIEGPDKDCRFTLQEGPDLMLGRSPSVLYHLHDPTVERSHCQILMDGDHATVVDDDSSAGTFVNGARVRRQSMKVGDVLKVGNTLLRLQQLGGRNGPQQKARPASESPSQPEADEGPLAELSGQKLGHYQVGGKLGHGRACAVFKARDANDGRLVALKVLFPELAQQSEEVQSFVQAVKTVLALRHPNLVTLYGAGKSGGYCWVAMELIEGESLIAEVAKVRREGLLDWQPAFQVALQIARVLEYAHEQKLLHGHILPQNIFWRAKDKRAKLGDLVLSQALEKLVLRHRPDSAERDANTGFLAPERLTGAAGDARSDLYSLGAAVYSLITGQLPGRRRTVEASTYSPADSAIQAPFPLVVPQRFERVVRKLMARRPTERYPTAADLVGDLERIGELYAMQT
jgi:eukaryotic-like serine/threonine-protein kinase